MSDCVLFLLIFQVLCLSNSRMEFFKSAPEPNSVLKCLNIKNTMAKCWGRDRTVQWSLHTENTLHKRIENLMNMLLFHFSEGASNANNNCWLGCRAVLFSNHNWFQVFSISDLCSLENVWNDDFQTAHSQFSQWQLNFLSHCGLSSSLLPPSFF